MEHTTTNMSKAPSLASIRILAFLLFLLSSVSALQVTPGSKCASVCLDQQDGNSLDPAASSNSPDDMVCKDVEFYSDANGLKFKSCVECLQNSEQVNGTENDISWFLCKNHFRTPCCRNTNTASRQPAICDERLSLGLADTQEERFISL